MGLGQLTDRAAVQRAVDEFDAIGRDAFLRKYRFKPARDYFLVQGGRRYDSKAIVAAAHGYQHGTSLDATTFSGGDSTVAARLEKLGFEVSRPIAIPDWSVDELMLALDLYIRTRGTMTYSPRGPVVRELSDELRSLSIFGEEVRANPRFRNPSGVALKFHNFAAIDPTYGGRGMPHGSAGDRRVWDTWAGRPVELALAVREIRSRANGAESVPDTGEDEEYEAPEGRILYRAHRRYERDPGIVARKKAAVIRSTGRLACEVCDFESSEAFGVPGVIDVHHIVPLHLIGESSTRLDDLALVCPTCHRTLHRHRPILTPSELRARREGRLAAPIDPGR